MTENNEPKKPSVATEQEVSVVSNKPKQPVHNANQPKIRIDPRSADNIVQQMLANIIKTMGINGSEVTAEPGFASFTEISGKYNEHSFSVKYVPRTRKQIRDLMYISYDNYEFITDGGDVMRLEEFLFKIKKYIDEHFLLDLNTWKYVPRPDDLGVLDKVVSFFGAGKTR